MKIDGKSSIETDDNNKHWMCQSTVLGARSTSLYKLHLKQNVLSFTYVPAGAGVCNLYKGLLIASLLHLAQHSRGSYHTFSYCLRPGKWNKHLCEKKKDCFRRWPADGWKDKNKDRLTKLNLYVPSHPVWFPSRFMAILRGSLEQVSTPVEDNPFLLAP